MLRAEANVFVRQAQRGGLQSVADTVALRSEVPDAGLYYLERNDGVRSAGNLERFPEELERTSGGVFSYSLRGGPTQLAAGVVVPLSQGVRLVIARDAGQQLALAHQLRRTALIGFFLLALSGLVAGAVLSRLILRRVEAMRAASQRILSGDLSERLPESGTQDELDRLGRSLNEMLTRIDQLMGGLRDVSENIAHDLKTPLNRLRNTAEAALADPRGAVAHREGLERTIDAADEIIQTFNALLLIAKLEAGALERSREPIDLNALVRDVLELYEPVAEDAGLKLVADVEPHGVSILGNRQLVGQALANLVDNAIKYSKKPVRKLAAGREAVSSEAADAGHVPTNAHDGGAGAGVVHEQATSAVDPGRPIDEVRIGLIDHADGIEVRVDDAGPGISIEDRGRVLERFVRLEKSRTLPGTGLGLSLVAAVARLHDGHLELGDNNPGLRVALFFPKSDTL